MVHLNNDPGPQSEVIDHILIYGTFAIGIIAIFDAWNLVAARIWSRESVCTFSKNSCFSHKGCHEYFLAIRTVRGLHLANLSPQSKSEDIATSVTIQRVCSAIQTKTNRCSYQDEQRLRYCTLSLSPLGCWSQIHLQSSERQECVSSYSHQC